MALPSKFAKYDAMIDLLVDAVVREIEGVTETKTAAREHNFPAAVEINNTQTLQGANHATPDKAPVAIRTDCNAST